MLFCECVVFFFFGAEHLVDGGVRVRQLGARRLGALLVGRRLCPQRVVIFRESAVLFCECVVFFFFGAEHLADGGVRARHLGARFLGTRLVGRRLRPQRVVLVNENVMLFEQCDAFLLFILEHLGDGGVRAHSVGVRSHSVGVLGAKVRGGAIELLDPCRQRGNFRLGGAQLLPRLLQRRALRLVCLSRRLQSRHIPERSFMIVFEACRLSRQRIIHSSRLLHLGFQLRLGIL